MKKQWLYKQGETPTIFKGDSIQESLDNGWQETPVVETPEEAKLFDNEFPLFQKIALLECVGAFENGDVFVQNEGDDSDRWRIPKDTFDSTYKEVGYDTDSDGQGDVNLEDLDRDTLYNMAVNSDLRVPANIGKDKLIERLLESQE